MFPKILQKRSKLYVILLETSGKHPFHFLLLLLDEVMDQNETPLKLVLRS